MADKDLIEIHINPPDLFSRFERYPKELEKEMRFTLDQSLHHVWGSVPAYPQQRANSSYRRTGTLGRTLGISMQGGQSGKAEIFTIKSIGSSKYEARFGTRLHYAPQVIGTQTQKALFKSLRWWTMEDIRKKAEPGIVKLFNLMAERLVKFLGK